MKNRLDRSFYEQDTKKVARELLGKVLYHLNDGILTSGVITETEAYLGLKDSACHTFGGRRTERVESMYLSGGHSYVYQIYGLHFCFNVVTRDELKPEAVLIRALEPLDGVEAMRMRMRRRFGPEKSDRELCSGPGKLCQAMGIDRTDDGIPLDGGRLWIGEDHRVEKAKSKIVAGPRVGVDYATEPSHRPASEWPLRFRRKPGILLK